LAAAAAPFWDYPASYVGQGAIYRSSDAGATWTQTTAPNTNYWSGVASSADGTTLVAASQDVGIYRSLDAGANWTAMNAPGGWDFRPAVACSADGYRVVAAGLVDQVITWPYSGPWRWVSTPTNDWTSVACSADASKLVVAGSGLIYSSGDSGTTWTQTSAPTNLWSWSPIASSADGTKLVAEAYADAAGRNGQIYIYVSSDSGATWTQTSAQTDTYWSGVASSADGTRLVAVTGSQFYEGPYTDDAIWSSSNAGITWTRTSAPCLNWASVASSSSGTNLVALWPGSNYVVGGAIYGSSDAGTTWWVQSNAPSAAWHSVASSADGGKLVAVAGALRDPAASNYYYTNGAIYHSFDAGVTWTRTTAPAAEWQAIASSADGTILCALPDGWGSYNEPEISTNSGASWAPTILPAGWWSAVAASADGSFLVVAGSGQIATLHAPVPAPPIPPSPQLAIDRPGANLELSWLAPSTPFVLEQTADLRSADWLAVPTLPTLNLTNLHYQLTLTPASGKSFYRLAQQ
jgi:hypothetical protein